MAASIVAELTATTTEFMAKMGEAEAEVSKLNTEGSANMQKFSAVGQAAFLATGAAVVAVGGMALDLAVKFDASVAKIQGSAQITQKAAQGIGDAFLKTAGDSTFSGQEMADAFAPVAGVIQTVAGHTLTAADATKVMAAASDLAEASGQPLAATTADLSQVMQAYGLNLNQTADASNVLYNTSRLTGVPLDTLTSTVDKLHMKLGVAAPDLTSVGGLMEDLAQHGVSGSRGVLIASTAMTTLLGNSKPVETELKTLGVNVYDSSGKFIGMSAALAQLSPKLAEMSDKQRTAAEATLFGASAGVAMNATVLAGAPAFNKATAAVSAHGAVEKAAAASSGTLEGQIKTLKASAEDYATLLGQKLIPIVTSVITWMDKHKQIAVDLAAVVGGVLVVSMGVALVGALSKVNDALTLTGKAAKLFGAEAAEGETAAELPLLPWIAVIALVAVAAYELYDHWNTVWNGIKAATSAAWDFIKQAFDDAVAFVEKYELEIVAALILITGPFGLIIAAALLLWDNWKTIWSGIQTALQVVWAVIKPIFDLLVDVLKVTIVAPLELLGDTFKIVWALIELAVRTAWQLMKAEIDAGIAVYDAVIAPALHAMQAVFSAVWGAVSSVVSAAWSVIRPILAAIVSVGIDAVKTDISGLSSVWSGVWGTVKSAVQDAWNIIRPIFSAISSTAQTVATAVGKVTGAIGKVTGAAGKITGGITGVLGKLAGGGPAAANTPYLIGEEGPEIFVPSGSGTVLPNSVFAGTGGGTALSGGLRGSTATGGDVALTIPFVVDGKTLATAVVPSVRTLLLQKKKQTGSLGLA